ncbi:tRNA (guanine(10)-N2)-methyltransferase [Sesamum angolense]|uniref:tRNA (guanine(10)-N(2))-methyltransferase n=1 Tax=Sesamum angolense TaxID=2727404 RepID=A0AAE2BY98_9LAMI|nr:tRNA (guanine(10)-N2)-methyltransferase [Sesamum angolense]
MHCLFCFGKRSSNPAGLFEGCSGATTLEWRLPDDHHPDSPFHFVNLPSEEMARDIAGRSILVKGIYELWGEGRSFEELEEAINSYPDDRKLPYLAPGTTFKITVESFGKAISSHEQSDRFQKLAFIPFKGKVNLRNPDRFCLMDNDDYGDNNGLPPIVQRRIFFGREVGASDRKILQIYQLKSRKYLGPTAMDAEMAFLMANQAQVKPGKLVYDPFVGTGSILIAAAHFGAMTMYGLPMPLSLLRADNNLPTLAFWVKRGKGIRLPSECTDDDSILNVFDAIICDPPYGVRAGGRKSGGRKLLKGVIGPYTVPDDKRTDHIPSTAPYSLVECVHDLLDLAARMLVMGGRLVYFYPVLREEDSPEPTFPEHPCFELIATCEQILSYRYSRVLLTMVKVAPYCEEIELAAKLKHMEFKENHLKWLEDGNLHSAVFSPADVQINGTGEKFSSKPKYRGKYV